MADFNAVFPHQQVFLPVVHLNSSDMQKPLRNLEIAVGEGVDGAWLVNHRTTPKRMLEIWNEARSRYPDFWLGLNFLGVTNDMAVMHAPKDLPGLWVDNLGVEGEGSDHSAVASANRTLREQQGFAGLHFGGVAFKHQPVGTDPVIAAMRAKKFTDIVTTSGTATGTAPSVQKIRNMYEAIDPFPLAVASGMTPENVIDFCPYVRCYIVATGISTEKDDLDAHGIQAFLKAIGR